MATYEEIYGKRVKEFDSDPTLNSTYEGQVWYDKSTGVLKSVVTFSAFSSAPPMSNARNQAIGGIGTKDATIAAGLSSSDGTSEEYNGTGWSSGGTLNNPGSLGTGCGTLTAGSRFGGIQPTPAGKDSNYHEHYDGTSWTAQTGMPFDSYQNACGGTQTANIVVQSFFNPTPSSAGFPTATAEWGGSSWTAGGSINTARRDAFSSKGGAAQTATFLAGGGAPGPVKNNMEIYDGTSWTEVGNLNTARARGGGGGSSTVGIIVGGTADPPRTTATESWDGSSWTTNSFSLGTAVDTQGSAFAESTNGVTFGGSSDSGTTAATEELNTSINTITAASWASGGNLNTARDEGASSQNGLQTAALYFGGYASDPSSNATEQYNGTSWTSKNNLNTARYSGAGAGTTTAALYSGGFSNPSTLQSAVEEFDGTNWATQPNSLSTARVNCGGCGLQTAALVFGGVTPSPGASVTNTEEYDGSSWTNGGAMPVGRSHFAGAGVGIQTAALAAGGNTAAPATYTNSSVEYGGESWTAGGTLVTGANNGGGAGTLTDAIIFGGSTAPGAPNYSVLTQGYDGTAFSTRPSMATARVYVSGTGTAAAGLAFGGNTPPYTAATEEFTGETGTANIATFSVS